MNQEVDMNQKVTILHKGLLPNKIRSHIRSWGRDIRQEFREIAVDLLCQIPRPDQTIGGIKRYQGEVVKQLRRKNVCDSLITIIQHELLYMVLIWHKEEPKQPLGWIWASERLLRRWGVWRLKV